MTIGDRLADMPALWNILRRYMEANYRGEKDIVRRELQDGQSREGLRILDFGCGTGELAGLFPIGMYTGMDLSSTYIGYARHKYGPRFQVMDGQALGYADNSFDQGLVVGVFHHLADEPVRRMAAELSRVLRPGGQLLVMEDTPTRDWWNLPGQLMHLVDRGGHIRDEQGYFALFEGLFALDKTYPMRSGVCDYRVLVLRNVKQKG